MVFTAGGTKAVPWSGVTMSADMTHVLRALHIGARRVAKAHGAHTHSRHVVWRGLTIGIENDIGSTRSGTDPDGKAWSTTMVTPYGEILGTEGTDHGDCVDVFLREAGLNSMVDVYIIGIVDASGKFDEEKVYLGFHGRDEVLHDFSEHYDAPEKYFGYIVKMPVDLFVRRCMEPGQRGKSFAHNAESRARLGQRQMRRMQAEREDRADWLKAMVKKAQDVRYVAKGLGVDQLRSEIAELEARRQIADARESFGDSWDDVPETPVIDYRLGLLRYALKMAEAPHEVSKALQMPSPEEDLYIRIWPGKNALDLQNEVIPVDLIYKSWAYYVECGNIDLEHISKTGGKSWREKAAKIEAAGFDPRHRFARIQYEIGRPVPNSLRIEEMDDHGNVTDFSFVARIYGGGNEAAQWFRSTLPHIPWKPSVGGAMSEPVEIWADIDMPQRNLNRRQKVKFARDFRWSNVGLTLEPVNSAVRTIELLSAEEVAELVADREMMGVQVTGGNAPDVPSPESSVGA